MSLKTKVILIALVTVIIVSGIGVGAYLKLSKTSEVSAQAGNSNNRLSMEEEIAPIVKEEVISTGKASITVYAPPATDIDLSIGGAAAEFLGTTNQLGYITKSVEIANENVFGARCTLTASYTDDNTCKDYETVHVVKKEFRQFSRPLRGIGAIHFLYR